MIDPLPVPNLTEALARYGFELDRFLEYERKMFRRELPEGISYTYGNRLGGALDAVVRELRERPDSRRAYVSIWDTPSDVTGDAAPCLTWGVVEEAASRERQPCGFGTRSSSSSLSPSRTAARRTPRARRERSSRSSCPIARTSNT